MEHRALYPPYPASEIITLWIITFCVEEDITVPVASCGGRTLAPGTSGGSWTLIDLITSHGLQVWTPAAPTLWEVVTVGGQQLWSNLTEPRSQALHLNTILSKYFRCCSYIGRFYYRRACAIPDPDTDTVVITGGLSSQNTVSMYSDQGWQADLPNINIGRYGHACAGYMSGGRRVR